MRTNEGPSQLLIGARRALVLVAALTSAAGCAVAQGSARDEAEGEPIPVVVEEEPASCIDAPNDAVCSAWARFLE